MSEKQLTANVGPGSNTSKDGQLKTMHWTNLSPLDNSVGFPDTFPLDSDLFSGQRYPVFE